MYPAPVLAVWDFASWHLEVKINAHTYVMDVVSIWDHTSKACLVCLCLTEGRVMSIHMMFKKNTQSVWGIVRVCLCVRLDWLLWLSPLPARQQATFINYWNRSVSRMRAKTGCTCLHLSLCFTASHYWFKAEALRFYPKAAEDQLIVASFFHLKICMKAFFPSQVGSTSNGKTYP